MIATALLAAALSSPASAQSLDASRLAADAALAGAFNGLADPQVDAPQEPILQPPLEPVPAGPVGAKGVVARASLPTVSENSRHLMTRTFGARALDLGVATDAAFKSYFLTFSDAKTTTLAALGDLNRLRGAGVDARVDASTVYNFKVAINIFSPVRGSTLKMTPAQGTRGPQNDVKTGALLDAIRAKSVFFKAGGQELWMFYGADAKPDASGFADTNSFLFIHENGLSSKAWPLAESKVPVGAPVSVDLGGIKLVLTRSADGSLTIQE